MTIRFAPSSSGIFFRLTMQVFLIILWVLAEKISMKHHWLVTRWHCEAIQLQRSLGSICERSQGARVKIILGLGPILVTWEIFSYSDLYLGLCKRWEVPLNFMRTQQLGNFDRASLIDVRTVADRGNRETTRVGFGLSSLHCLYPPSLQALLSNDLLERSVWFCLSQVEGTEARESLKGWGELP